MNPLQQIEVVNLDSLLERIGDEKKLASLDMARRKTSIKTVDRFDIGFYLECLYLPPEEAKKKTKGESDVLSTSH